MYQRQEDHWGYVPNYSKVFSQRPEVMARWGRLLAEIRRPADDRRFELITFAVAKQLKNSSCSLAHGSELAKIIGEANVIAIATGKEPDVLTKAEIAMMHFAQDIARDATKVTSGQVQILKVEHGFSDEDVFDIAAIASARCFFTKILDALGTEPDVAFMSINKRLRQHLAVGRPINHAKPEFTDQPSQNASTNSTA
jgi:hypothetical protein